jgi:uncharacterized protein (TIGR00725 family)
VTLYLDRAAGRLRRSDGRSFDPGARRWTPLAGDVRGESVALADAVAWLQRESGRPCRVPVGVIGPRQARPDQLAAGERLGRLLAEMGLVVLCGGREGVMEAACRGVSAAGGISVGLLPDDAADAANPYVGIPIATGLGVARNAVLARAALCLVAVGGGYGTISEAAFALQFGKPVLGLCEAPAIPGVIDCDGPEDAAAKVARIVLAIPLDARS